MFEDNPFYTPTKEELNAMKEVENTQENETTDTSTSIDENTETPIENLTNEDMSYEVKFIDNDIPVEPTKSDKIDAVAEEKVQTPETPKVEEKQSTGVSSYQEIPDINETTKQTPKYTSDHTQLFLIVTFALIVFIIKKFKDNKYIKKLQKYINIKKIANISHKYSLLINISVFILTILLFSFPNTFNVGISGQLGILPLLIMGALAITNGNILSKKLCLYCKTCGKYEKYIKNKIYTFPGLNILRLSLTLFTITTLLFFSLTESAKTLGIIYILTFGNVALLVLSREGREISETLKNKKKDLLLTTIYISTVGIIINSYIITILGAILFGYSIIYKTKEIE